MFIDQLHGSVIRDGKGNVYGVRRIAKMVEGSEMEFEYVIRKNGRNLSERIPKDEASTLTLEEYLKEELLDYEIKGGMYKMNQWSDLIEEWAVKRGLDKLEDLQGQTLKLSEEGGELADALLRNHDEDIKDAAGDSMVVLRISALQNGHDFKEILHDANRASSKGIPAMFRGHIGVYKFMAVIGEMSSYAARGQRIPYDLYVDGVHAVLETVNFRPLFQKPDDWYLEDACYFAYGHIKGRTGMIHNGVYMKREDIYKSGDEDLIEEFEFRFGIEHE